MALVNVDPWSAISGKTYSSSPDSCMKSSSSDIVVIAWTAEKALHNKLNVDFDVDGKLLRERVKVNRFKFACNCGVVFGPVFQPGAPQASGSGALKAFPALVAGLAASAPPTIIAARYNNNSWSRTSNSLADIANLHTTNLWSIIEPNPVAFD